MQHVTMMKNIVDNTLWGIDAFWVTLHSYLASTIALKFWYRINLPEFCQAVILAQTASAASWKQSAKQYNVIEFYIL